LENTTVNDEGRLVVPALWQEGHLLRMPSNYDLALKILKSLHKKLKFDTEKIKQYESLIRQQIDDCIVEEVDIETRRKDTNASFLGHNAAFREKAESTKCRVVYWSNLAEKGKGNLSHNQVSLPGPNSNSKIYLALTLMRFNKFLLVFDL